MDFPQEEYRALSSTEAEYCTIVTTTQEIESISSRYTGRLGVIFTENVPLLMVILTENLGASLIARNPIAHSRLKHAALDHLYFVREERKRERW